MSKGGGGLPNSDNDGQGGQGEDLTFCRTSFVNGPLVQIQPVLDVELLMSAKFNVSRAFFKRLALEASTHLPLLNICIKQCNLKYIGMFCALIKFLL